METTLRKISRFITVFKSCIILMWCLLVAPTVKSQEVVFSQYHTTPLNNNPALAGLKKDVYLSTNFRSQWRSIEVPVSTFQFTYIHPIYYRRKAESDHLGGIGLNIYNDVIGDGVAFRTTGGSISGAYNIRPGRRSGHIISFGGQIGFVQRSFDISNAQLGSQFNDIIGFDEQITPSVGNSLNDRISYPVFNAGVVWYYNPSSRYYLYNWSFFIGGSIGNLNEPNEAFISEEDSPLPRIYKGIGGIEVKLSSKLRISPNTLILSQNGIYQFNVGNYFTYNFQNNKRGNVKQIDVVAGLWYRFKDSFIGSIGINADNFSFGLSYDLNVSALNSFTNGNGAYEISATYTISKSKGLRKFSSPLL